MMYVVYFFPLQLFILQQLELDINAKEKKMKLKEVKDKIDYFNEKIRDTHTSQSAVDRMRKEIETGIEELK